VVKDLSADAAYRKREGRGKARRGTESPPTPRDTGVSGETVLVAKREAGPLPKELFGPRRKEGIEQSPGQLPEKSGMGVSREIRRKMIAIGGDLHVDQDLCFY